MAVNIIPQDLLIYRSILASSFAKITNEMYANNNKLSFKYEFDIVPVAKKPSAFLVTAKPLYLFRVLCIDKSRNPIGEIHYLYNNYYPKDITDTIYTLERRAIQDWFTNATKALYNVIQEDYMTVKQEQQRIFDERSAKGITKDVIKAEIAKKDNQRIMEQEANVMKMMHPNLK